MSSLWHDMSLVVPKEPLNHNQPTRSAFQVLMNNQLFILVYGMVHQWTMHIGNSLL